MIDVSEVLNDPDFCQSWVVRRSSGTWVNGVWTENAPELVDMSGVTNPATNKDLMMVPEGDRITELRTFYSTETIFTTRSGEEEGTSDQIEYKGELFRVIATKDHMDYGYNKAIAVRMAGS